MATQQGYQITLSKGAQNGQPARDFGVWAGKTGGESTREVTDYYPGAMQPARKLTGVATTSDIVIRKLEDDLTDDDWRTLYADLNTQNQYTVVTQGLNSADNPRGAPRSYRCLLTGTTPTDIDSGSSDAAEVSLTLSVFGLPTIA